MAGMPYCPPEVRDFGTLSDLTSDIDVNFVGLALKSVSLAAVSGGFGVAIPGGDVLPDAAQSEGAPPTDVAGTGAGGAAPAGGGGGGSGGGGAGGGGGGGLPFTGLGLVLPAAVGAALATAGAAVRSRLRRAP